MEKQKIKKSKESAWNTVAKRTVIAAENKPIPQKTVADKKGKEVSKKAFSEAAKRTVNGRKA
jgi:hypothetical protein